MSKGEWFHSLPASEPGEPLTRAEEYSEEYFDQMHAMHTATLGMSDGRGHEAARDHLAVLEGMNPENTARLAAAQADVAEAFSPAEEQV